MFPVEPSTPPDPTFEGIVAVFYPALDSEYVWRFIDIPRHSLLPEKVISDRVISNQFGFRCYLLITDH